VLFRSDVLKISYNKSEDDKCCDIDDCNYLHKGIARRSFNLGYKIAPKFKLVAAEAEMKNGLLKISVPFAEEAKPKALKIK
jgi:HSP20 family molecular chaperone IbpA